MDPPRTQSPLSYLEPSSCPQNDVTRGHLHLLEEYFHVIMRDVVMVEDSQGPQDNDTFMVERHKSHGVMLAGRAALIRSESHEDDQLAFGVSCATGPPF